MGKRKDYAGTRWGSLICVETLDEPCVIAGRKYTSVRCVCDCGKETVVPVVYVSRAYYDQRCPDCRSKKCEVCDAVFYPANNLQKVCSANCRRIKTNERILAYRKRLAELENSDPDAAAICQKHRLREMERVKERRKTDPEFVARLRKKNSNWFKRNRDKVRLKKRERLQRMSQEERDQFILKHRRQSAQSYQRCKANPEWIKKRAMYNRQYAQKAHIAKIESEMTQITDQSGAVRPCMDCGSPIVGRKAGSKFCSQRCAHKSWRKRMILTNNETQMENSTNGSN